MGEYTRFPSQRRILALNFSFLDVAKASRTRDNRFRFQP
jgi:hypothetical protein